MDHQVTLEEVLAKAMEEPEFREEWEKQRPLREFSSALIRARMAAGISQTELARRIGVKQPMIARMENALQMPKIDTLMRLAEALGTDFTITAVYSIKTEPHSFDGRIGSSILTGLISAWSSRCHPTIARQSRQR